MSHQRTRLDIDALAEKYANASDLPSKRPTISLVTRKTMTDKWQVPTNVKKANAIEQDKLTFHKLPEDVKVQAPLKKVQIVQVQEGDYFGIQVENKGNLLMVMYVSVNGKPLVMFDNKEMPQLVKPTQPLCHFSTRHVNHDMWQLKFLTNKVSDGSRIAVDKLESIGIIDVILCEYEIKKHFRPDRVEPAGNNVRGDGPYNVKQSHTKRHGITAASVEHKTKAPSRQGVGRATKCLAAVRFVCRNALGFVHELLGRGLRQELVDLGLAPELGPAVVIDLTGDDEVVDTNQSKKRKRLRKVASIRGTGNPEDESLEQEDEYQEEPAAKRVHFDIFDGDDVIE